MYLTVVIYASNKAKLALLVEAFDTFIVEATVVTIVNCNCNTFKAQVKEVCLRAEDLKGTSPG